MVVQNSHFLTPLRISKASALDIRKLFFSSEILTEIQALEVEAVDLVAFPKMGESPFRGNIMILALFEGYFQELWLCKCILLGS